MATLFRRNFFFSADTELEVECGYSSSNTLVYFIFISKLYVKGYGFLVFVAHPREGFSKTKKEGRGEVVLPV